MMDLKLYKRPLTAITVASDKARVTPGVLSKLGGALGAVSVNVYAVSTGEYSISLYVDEAEHEKAKKALHEVVEKHSAFDSLTSGKSVGMITVTGPEYMNTPGMMSGILNPLAKLSVNVLGVSTSFDSLLLFVDWSDAKKAYESIEKQFVKGI